MDGLRWLLLFFGLLVVVGVYLYTRRERDRPTESPAPTNRIAPLLGSEPGVPEHADPVTGAAADGETGDRSPEQKIVTLRLVARNKGAFPGDELALSLRGIGMRHGKFGIFHRYEDSDESSLIFSIASLVEPGSFDLANLKGQRIPGIAISRS